MMNGTGLIPDPIINKKLRTHFLYVMENNIFFGEKGLTNLQKFRI